MIGFGSSQPVLLRDTSIAGGELSGGGGGSRDGGWEIWTREVQIAWLEKGRQGDWKVNFLTLRTALDDLKMSNQFR